MHATLRNGLKCNLKTINTTLSLSVSVLYQIWCFSDIIYLNSSKFTGTLDAQYLFAQAKTFGFLQLFRGLTRKKPEFLHANRPDPKKLGP